jgi:nucleotide-binding universal stress UspA family protein
LWIAEHRAAIEKELGWQVQTADAASDLVSQRKERPGQVISRLGGKLLETIALDKLVEPGPPPGQWRQERLSGQEEERLFREVLVPVNGTENGWYALEQALVVAQREGAHLRGLHVIPSEKHVEMDAAHEVQAHFNRRCEQSGVSGELVIATGEVTRQICSRARWTDLIVTNLAYPPASQPLARLSSGFREMIQRCPRPVLATPQTATPLSRALLAYDGSPKAEEALYVSTYIAGKWQIPLVVVTVLENGDIASPVLERARQYLEAHQVQATYVLEQGPTGETILKAAEDYACDLLVMGGYGYSPFVEVVLGSVVDQVLRQSRKPMLICR